MLNLLNPSKNQQFALEKGWLEDYIPFWEGLVSGVMFVVGSFSYVMLVQFPIPLSIQTLSDFQVMHQNDDTQTKFHPYRAVHGTSEVEDYNREK